MSKGKAPAKGAAPPAAENPDGAKFATVQLGTSEHPISMLINLNCPVDIILDNIKRLMVKKIDVLIQDLHNAPKLDAPPAAEAPDNPVDVGDPAAKLLQIKSKLSAPDCTIDLSETGTGAAANCKDVSFLADFAFLLCSALINAFNILTALEEIGF